MLGELAAARQSTCPGVRITRELLEAESARGERDADRSLHAPTAGSDGPSTHVARLSSRSSIGFALAAACIGLVLTATYAATWSSAAASLPSLQSSVGSSFPGSSPPATLALADPLPRASRHEPSNTREFVVSIAAPDGTPFRNPWQLALRSALHAPLDLGFESGSESIRVELGQGRWTLEAHADDLMARAVELDVDATTLGANLQFLPVAQVFGSIFDDRGDAVIGLPLHLRDLDGSLAASATSDGAGTFQFCSIPAGSYELLAGRGESPLRPTRVLELGAGKHVLEPLRTARLSEYRLRVVTEDGRPVAGASVEGTGRTGGGFYGSTSADGSFLARFLPPGRYRVVASRDDLGIGEGRLDVGAEAPALAAILLRR